ncbi:hemolysin family protein [Temperatibacter marinus]|uniref:Hemolysin family protein n=1 Tax=Temperatibacter marinus TaxID=1456591 RepID=A0AA52EFX9_9PROT|nr:hemolysin family protein [Temperatibacter marinus]WND01346.1 hemolysin family protein [Temperatibacter marinus]
MSEPQKSGLNGKENSLPPAQGGFWGGLKSLFRKGSEPTLRESVEEALEEHEEDTNGKSLGADEKEMLFNVLNYGELRVDDVMVPRADIISVDMEIGLKDLLKTFSKAGHSRFPVYRGNLDDVMGMVHVKDALKLLTENDYSKAGFDGFSLMTIQRSVLFVPASMRVMDLLAKMRQNRTHMAIVVDEYGGTDGIVTIEDLVEEIVGEIEDEHDDDVTQQVRKMGKDTWLVDARLEMEDLEDALSQSFMDIDDDEDIDTVGGLVFALAGSVPEIGERVKHENGYQFEVVDADPRRIHKVRIMSPKATLTKNATKKLSKRKEKQI